MSDCTFSGKLKSGSHYINGQSAFKDTHKLVVKACKFESTANNSINIDSNNNFVSINFKDQSFNDANVSRMKSSYIKWKSVYTIAFPAVALFIISTVILVWKKKKSSSNDTEIHSDSQFNIEECINRSLI